MDNDQFKDTMDDILSKAKVFAEQAGKKAGEIAEVIGEKTNQFYDAAKKKVEIEKIEYALSKKYKELGKIAYAAKKDGAEFECDGVCAEITTLLDALEVLNTEEESQDAEVVQEETEE